jgi:hypothetical protein
VSQRVKRAERRRRQRELGLETTRQEAEAEHRWACRIASETTPIDTALDAALAMLTKRDTER